MLRIIFLTSHSRQTALVKKHVIKTQSLILLDKVAMITIIGEHGLRNKTDLKIWKNDALYKIIRNGENQSKKVQTL